MGTRYDKLLSRWVSYALPFVLIGILGYASWAVTKPICLDYIQSQIPSRPLAIAFITVHYALFFLLMGSYIRVLATVRFNPGYCPLAQPAHKSSAALSDLESLPRSRPGTFPPLSDFVSKRAFVCESDGLPRWCSVCSSWKPDRSHHCSEVDRCVYRMDHFCPWVGGVVSETSTRYFIQTVFWGAIYTSFLIGAMAYVLSKGNVGKESLSVVALAVLFWIFCLVMFWSTADMLGRNSGTVDALNEKVKVYTIAIRDDKPSPKPEKVPRVWLEGKCYHLVHTKPGENPWRLEGGRWRNFVEATGGSKWGLLAWWGVPAPGTSGEGGGFYKWNEKLMKRLKMEAGIVTEGEKEVYQ